ncbi:MAG TPA: serine/threonine protein kinase [Xanthobacteraceae bacterium]|nr:serine/threonine protein kinase [Xanthobacteraceae bacterium]
MSAPLPPELAQRWRPSLVLKRDVFSTVERGRFVTPEGEIDAVLRRTDGVPWWSRLLARHLFRRERRALAAAAPLAIAPRLLYADDTFLVRSFIDGVALHIARPAGDLAYFRSARDALRRLHRLGVTHNDLAKEQNWLRGADGKAYVTDFQLAFVFRRRSKLFRLAAYEDLRHALKHKRTYAPQALTAAERRILARKSLPTRIWMATGKRVYRAITRGVFGFVDREGGGPRLVHDAPVIVAALKTSAQVRDAAVVAYPDRRSGTGLYAFVETLQPGCERELLDAIASRKITAPERLQIVPALPRNASGGVRLEILQLVAMNQVDLIDQLVTSAAERELVAGIVAGRQNLRDRFSF